MEVLESGEQSALQWDRKLSELSEPGDPEALTYPTVRTRGAGRADQDGECGHRRTAGDRALGWTRLARGSPERRDLGRGVFFLFLSEQIKVDS